jgi:hypothetical protein
MSFLFVLLCVGAAAGVHVAPAAEKRSLEKRLFWAPVQIHLSWTNQSSEMAVTWLSWFQGTQSVVEYGLHGQALTQSVSGDVTTFVDPDSEIGTTRYVHRAVMTGLKQGLQYDYQVKDLTFVGVSSTHSFWSRNDSAPMRYAVFGDFGLINAQSLGLLTAFATAPRGSDRHIDAIVHNGDFAYNLDDIDGLRGDEFFDMMEPIVAAKSYMVSPGNHERAANFSHYRHRFSMPMREVHNNLYWSLDVGLVHFIAFDAELYYFDSYHTWVAMEKWLRADLAAANANRKNVPWIIAFGHRPLYCTAASDDYEDECALKNNVQRHRLEDVFCEGGVDLVIGAHMHDYERTLPVYQEQVIDMQGDPYNDPPVPVYLVSGAAGCQEDTDRFVNHTAKWSAYKNTLYGIGLMTIHNATALTYSQFLANETATAAPVDTFTLYRQNRNAPHPVCNKKK